MRSRQPFSDRVAQQVGYFHGGGVGALGDTAGGYAALSLMELAGDILTLEYKINFLRPASGPLLVAVGSVPRQGRTVSVTRAEVFVEAGGERRLCAAAQQSIKRVPPKPGGTSDS